MREVYDKELDAVGRTMVEMAGIAGAALACATGALLRADLLAEAVIVRDEAVEALCKDLDARIRGLRPPDRQPRQTVTRTAPRPAATR